MGGFHEFESAVFHIGDPLAREFNFQVEGMETGTEKHGNVAKRNSLIGQRHNFIDNKTGLTVFTPGVNQLGGIAAPPF